MSKVKLQELLTEHLHLKEPTFKLERIGSKLAGSIISESFKGKSVATRLHMLWKALDAALAQKPSTTSAHSFSILPKNGISICRTCPKPRRDDSRPEIHIGWRGVWVVKCLDNLIDPAPRVILR